MLPHCIAPAKMCKLFLEEKFPESETAQAQLTLFHIGMGRAGLVLTGACVSLKHESCSGGGALSGRYEGCGRVCCADDDASALGAAGAAGGTAA